MAGLKRMALGAFFFFLGTGIVGALETNSDAVALGALVFLLGVALILWGAGASLSSWWSRSRHPARGPLNRVQRPLATSPPLPAFADPPSYPPAHPAPPPPPYVAPFPSPPAYAAPPPPIHVAPSPPPPQFRIQPAVPPNLGMQPQGTAPLSGAAFPVGPDAVEEYVVEYEERGIFRRTSFATLETADKFHRALVSPRGMFRVTPQGKVPILVVSRSSVPASQSAGSGQAKVEVPRAPEFLRVAEFIDQYRPSRRFDRELFLQIELAEALRGKFGREAVTTEVTIPGGGRVDIEVCGVGVELKVAASTAALATLPSQLENYRDHYGPNLIAVVFDDTGDSGAVVTAKEATRRMGVRLTVIRHR
jgi:hypothetical protein